MQCVLCEEPLTFGYESLTNIRGCLSIAGALLCFAFPRCFEIHVESAHPSSQDTTVQTPPLGVTWCAGELEQDRQASNTR